MMRVTTICCFSTVWKEEPTAAHYVFAFGGLSRVCVCVQLDKLKTHHRKRIEKLAAQQEREASHAMYCTVM